jgi:iron-sulfur cluster assembly protein
MSDVTFESAEIKVTPKALYQLNKLKEENNIPKEFGLRVGVKGGGCSGFSYHMGFDKSPGEGDAIIETDELKIFIDGKSLFFLTGCELDFSDGLNGKGFVFNNPNATKTCGCGQSFSA